MSRDDSINIFKEMHLPPILKTYLDYTKGNETPTLFHLWIGISVLAGACERRIWIDTGFFKTGLNFYIILVSPPGICGKNTAFGMGYKLLKRANFNIVRDAITKEKIIVEMEDNRKVFNPENTGKIFQHSSITLVEEELNILTTSGQEMIKFLTSIYDTTDTYYYKTKHSGQYEIINPFLNLGGAAVPSWFSSDVANDVGNMGFLARSIVVFENEPRGIHPIPYMPPEQKALADVILSKLDKIGTMFGTITFDREAQDYFETWYKEHPIDVTEDYRILGYLVRKRRIHIWKLAALFAVANDRYIIKKEDIIGAIELLDYTEKKLRLAFSTIGGNKTAYLTNRVITYIHNEGGKVPLEKVVRKFYDEPSMTRQEFKDVIDTITEMHIARLSISGNDRYLELMVKDLDTIDKYLV